MPALKKIWQAFMQMHESRDVSFALAKNGLAKWQSMAVDMMDREDTFVLVAVSEAVPVGFCLGWIARNPPIYSVSELGFISEIAVDQAAQRQGVGTALIAAARAWFAQRQLEEFQLSTAVWNAGAQTFWKSLGGEPLLVRFRFHV